MSTIELENDEIYVFQSLSISATHERWHRTITPGLPIIPHMVGNHIIKRGFARANRVPIGVSVFTNGGLSLERKRAFA